MNVYGLNLEKQKTAEPTYGIEDSIGVIGSSIGKANKT
jgi:hypothetical protein